MNYVLSRQYHIPVYLALLMIFSIHYPLPSTLSLLEIIHQHSPCRPMRMSKSFAMVDMENTLSKIPFYLCQMHIHNIMTIKNKSRLETSHLKS